MNRKFWIPKWYEMLAYVVIFAPILVVGYFAMVLILETLTGGK